MNNATFWLLIRISKGGEQNSFIISAQQQQKFQQANLQEDPCSLWVFHTTALFLSEWVTLQETHLFIFGTMFRAQKKGWN